MTQPLPPDPLTRREREVLAGILDHKTAKEMARDLGVSHHAVEKRLKRARQKLGAGSSLEAAKLYRERYQRPVSGPPDLAEAGADDHRVNDPAAAGSRSLRQRMILMPIATLVTAGAAVFLLQQPQAEPTTPVSPEAAVENALAKELRALDEVFASTDRDRSGALDIREFAPEAFFKDLKIDKLPSGIDIEAAAKGTKRRREAMFAIFDRNDDGKIDKGEFVAGYREGLGPRYLDEVEISPPLTGLPVRHPTRIGIRSENGDDIHRAAFRMADRNKSGTIDLDEFFNLSPVRREVSSERSPDQVAAATKIFRFINSDKDGTVDRDEFATVTFTDDDGNSYEFEVFDSSKG